jgi:hypothetical protein
MVLFILISAAFIIFGIGILLLGDILLKRVIRIELNQRGYKLISVKDTEDTFEPPKPVTTSEPTSFRQYLKAEHGVTVGRYRKSRSEKLYKEVLFSVPGDKTIRTLASARMLLFLPYRIQFKINLDDLN